MDVEDVITTFYDTLRIAGKVKIQSNDAVLKTQVESDMIYEWEGRLETDPWKD